MEPVRCGNSYDQYEQSSNVKAVTPEQYNKAYLYLQRDLSIKVNTIANSLLPCEIKIEKLEKIKNKISINEKIINSGQQYLYELIFTINMLEPELKYKQNEYDFVSIKCDKDFSANAYALYKIGQELNTLKAKIQTLETEKLYYTNKPSKANVEKSLQSVNSSIDQLKKQRQSPTSDRPFTPFTYQYSEIDRSQALYLNAYTYLDEALENGYFSYKVEQICKSPSTSIDKIAQLKEMEMEISTYLANIEKGQVYLESCGKLSVSELKNYVQFTTKKIQNFIDQLKTQEQTSSFGYKPSTNQPSYGQPTYAKPMQQQSMNQQPIYQTYSQSYVQETGKSQQANLFNLDKANLLMDDRVIALLEKSTGDSIQNIMDKIKKAQEDQIEGFKIKFQNESGSKAYENALNDLTKMQENRYQMIETAFSTFKGLYLIFFKSEITKTEIFYSIDYFRSQLKKNTKIDDFNNSEGILLALEKIYLHGFNQPLDFPKEPENFIMPKDTNLKSAVNQYLNAKINHDYASLFGLKPGYTEEDVTKAFRKFTLSIHPDRNPEFQNEATALFAFFQNIAEYLKQTLKK